MWLKTGAVGDESPTGKKKPCPQKKTHTLVPPEMYWLIIPYGDFKMCSSLSNFVLQLNKRIIVQRAPCYSVLTTRLCHYTSFVTDPYLLEFCGKKDQGKKSMYLSLFFLFYHLLCVTVQYKSDCAEKNGENIYSQNKQKF